MRGYDNKALFRTPIQFNRRWQDGPECCDPYSETSEANREQEHRAIASYCCDNSLDGMGAVTKERKLNVVNIILGSALLVCVVALVVAVTRGY